jgi:hypothetical protein
LPSYFEINFIKTSFNQHDISDTENTVFETQVNAIKVTSTIQCPINLKANKGLSVNTLMEVHILQPTGAQKYQNKIFALLLTYVRYKYRMIEKSRNPFLTHVLFDKNINYTEIRKQKQCYFKCSKYQPRSAIHACTLFLMFDATR